MDEIHKKTAILVALFVLGFMFLQVHRMSITGMAIADGRCANYYEKWGNEVWFNDWNWWDENCDGFLESAICGNGILEPGEICDTNEELPCTLLGFESGMMVCTECKFDTRNCVGEVEVDYDALMDSGKGLQECISERDECLQELERLNESINDDDNQDDNINNNEITECRLISQPGEYKIKNNIEADGNCITITADNVVLDGQGYEIKNINTEDVLLGGIITINNTNITLKNFEINNYYMGMYIINSTEFKIIDNHFSFNDVGIGITEGYNGIVKNNLMQNQIQGLWIMDSNYITAENNTINVDERGILLDKARNSLIVSNNISALLGISQGKSSDTSTGYSGNANRVYNNIIKANQGYVNYSNDYEMIWNSSTGGNYWMYFNGTGHSETCNDSNNDGICDEPYEIDENNVDWMPLSRYGDDGFDDVLEPFTFQIQTTPEQLEFRFQIDDAFGMEIDWGLGEGWEELEDGSAIRAKEYPEAGIYDIKLRGQASRIAFMDIHKLNSEVYMYEGTPNLLYDILTPFSNSINGISSAKYMFANTNVINFTAKDFFDEVSENVLDMYRMFENSQFNQNISNWDVSNVKNMNWMFYFSKFNSDISKWNVSNVHSMVGMFFESIFNSDISSWNVNNVRNMSAMFTYSKFNSSISQWNVSSVKDMDWMFSNSLFNKDISQWNLNSAVNINGMFAYSKFNQDISNWNVSNVKYMSAMFINSQFNQDISKWDVSKVESVGGMFENSLFNQDISDWDVSNVWFMSSMFFNSSFNQDISQWDVSNVESMEYLFSNSNLSTENYDKILIGWASQSPNLNYGVELGAQGISYCEGEEAREILIEQHEWIIEDDGKNCS
ncbi:MAG: BspA family leucine-rich repeat surface protein [Candidatus Woesearchaeota archaeon]